MLSRGLRHWGLYQSCLEYSITTAIISNAAITLLYKLVAKMRVEILDSNEVQVQSKENSPLFKIALTKAMTKQVCSLFLSFPTSRGYLVQASVTGEGYLD